MTKQNRFDAMLYAVQLHVWLLLACIHCHFPVHRKTSPLAISYYLFCRYQGYITSRYITREKNRYCMHVSINEMTGYKVSECNVVP